MAKQLKKIKSNAPVYAVGAVWILYAMLFPLYRVMDYLIVAVLSGAAGFALSLVIPDRVIEVEEIEELGQTGNEMADDILTQGQAYLAKLAALEQNIENADMRGKIRQMREVATKIYRFLEQHPTQEKNIRMFNNYYMPTSIETLTTYQELEKSGAEFPGENVGTTMAKIDNAVATFTTAYQNLLDDLYQDKAMNVSADITVLQSMMEREGLVGVHNDLNLDPK